MSRSSRRYLFLSLWTEKGRESVQTWSLESTDPEQPIAGQMAAEEGLVWEAQGTWGSLSLETVIKSRGWSMCRSARRQELERMAYATHTLEGHALVYPSTWGAPPEGGALLSHSFTHVQTPPEHRLHALNSSSYQGYTSGHKGKFLPSGNLHFIAGTVAVGKRNRGCSGISVGWSGKAPLRRWHLGTAGQVCGERSHRLRRWEGQSLELGSTWCEE